MSRSGSVPGRGSSAGVSVPATPATARRSAQPGKSQGRLQDYIEIDDDELDELANATVPCSSPYFTQPTQVVNRANDRTTQPTQIVKRTTQPTQIISRTTQPTQIVRPPTLREPSSPGLPSSPSSAVEVPASSPFQPRSQSRPSVLMNKGSIASDRVRAMMAPAGTSFRSPVARPPSKPKPEVKRDYLEISDDDLDKGYKHQDSSDDQLPMRGDIRPSSFTKKSTMPAVPKQMPPLDMGDIELADIKDIRLRSLTKSVHRSVQGAKPGITYRACRDALLDGVVWEVSRAIELLLGKAPGSKAVPRDSAGKKTSQKLANPLAAKGPATSSASSLTAGAKNRPPLEPKRTSASTSTSALHRFSFDQTISVHPQKSFKSSTTTNPDLPRRRLLQAHKSSPSPPVFSVSSSPSSAPTSPALSEFPSPAKMTFGTAHREASSSPEPAPRAARRRLQRGRRNPSPASPAFPAVPAGRAGRAIIIDSSDESDAPIGRRKRKATTTNVDDRNPKRHQPTPIPETNDETQSSSVSPQSTSKDFNSSPISPDTSYDTKSSSKSSLKRKPDDALLADDSPTSKRHQSSPASGSSPKAPEAEEDTDTPEDPEKKVLDYINTSAPEVIARMSSFAVDDARRLVDARPFETLTDAQDVLGPMPKSKAKSRKPRKVGSLIVERLTTFFDAFAVVSRIIKKCEKRGTELQSVMSQWNMDKNGEPVTSSASVPLPIAQRPSLMAEDVQLKPYQLVGLNWLNLLYSKRYSGILADDMGLGKTIQVIAFLAHLVASRDPLEDDERHPPNLVVVPASTYENWLAEFDRFAPALKVQPYFGKTRRELEPEMAYDFDVVIAPYSQAEQKADMEFLRQVEWHAVIFDEGHTMKNRQTMRYKKMMQLPSDWRLMLSGTPVQNNLKELLTLLHFVEPELFREDGHGFEELDAIFETKVPNKDVHNFAAFSEERVGNARTIMTPFIFQRRKEVVLTLPDKVEKLVEVEMHPTQERIYREVKNHFTQKSSTPTENTKDAAPKVKVSNQWMQLRKAANHHQLFRAHFTDEIVEKMVDILWENHTADELYVQNKDARFKKKFLEQRKQDSDFELHLWCKEFKHEIGQFDIPERSWEESPKVQKLLELVRSYQNTQERVLVFSRFEIVMDILRETLSHAGIRYIDITGRTDVSERYPRIQEFNKDTDIPVFLLTTAAGGTGLNLTAANKVILFDQSDNPQDDVQASNRAHRIGQNREVEVTRLITKNSVESLVYNACLKKLTVASYVEGTLAVDESDVAATMEQLCRQQMLGHDEDKWKADDAAPASQID
ncbi:SNF2 family N-terminal domain-containing protein [Xylariomycetidae sp. FL0641]|nr:SNF2 family N-terminal domain-containing protein [Xylariomycetidae sp. FL0641]